MGNNAGFVFLLVAALLAAAAGQCRTIVNNACQTATQSANPNSLVGKQLNADVGCPCSGCATCARIKNPPFSKQCSITLALILDNTGSLDPYCSGVQTAVSGFVKGLANIQNAGGTVNLSIMKFANSQKLVYAQQPLTAAYAADAVAWTAGGTAGAASTQPGLAGYCNPTDGGTNWAGALLFAAQLVNSGTSGFGGKWEGRRGICLNVLKIFLFSCFRQSP